MRIKEIKKQIVTEKITKTYVAADGTVFYNEDECKKYEDSALFVVKSKLKPVVKNDMAYINDYASCDDYFVIYDVETPEDLDNLKNYIYLITSSVIGEEYAKEKVLNIFKDVTYGHEVFVMYSYDNDEAWIYGNGSIEDYGKYFYNMAMNQYEKGKAAKKENEEA